jgi:hypothetical protein
MSLIPRAPSPGATDSDRLRYVRRWAFLGFGLAIPIWVFVFLFVRTDVAAVAFALVTVLSVLNIASVTWRIRRADRR